MRIKLLRELQIFSLITALHFPALALFTHFSQVIANGPVEWKNWCRWDCELYVDLLSQYKPSAFFPAWPILGDCFRRGLKIFSTTSFPDGFYLITLSILFSLISARLILSLPARLDISLRDPKASPRFLGFSLHAWIFLVLLKTYPSSFFWLAGYSEPLFCLLLCLGLYFYFQNRMLSFLFFGLTAIVRPQGIWVVGLLGLFTLYEVWTQRKKTYALKPLQVFVECVLMSLPFLIYCAWLRVQTGNPIYFMEAQKKWGHQWSLERWVSCHIPLFRFDFFILAFSWYTAYRFRNRSVLYRFLAILGVVSAELPLMLTGWISWSRYQSLNLAAFLALAEICEESPMLLIPTLAYFIPNLAIKISAFATGAWEG